MANTSSRGGMKQSDNKQGGAKKHQGVRSGSTATRKERHQIDKREPVIDEERERRTADREKLAEGLARNRKPANRRKTTAAKKVREESPEKRGQIMAGTGKKSLYANMPKARKVR
jgi:hypothetical protein